MLKSSYLFQTFHADFLNSWEHFKAQELKKIRQTNKNYTSYYDLIIEIWGWFSMVKKKVRSKAPNFKFQLQKQLKSNGLTSSEIVGHIKT